MGYNPWEHKSWTWLGRSLSHVLLFATMDCSMAGFPVLHHLPEFAQTHVCRVGDVIQQSHPLSSPSLPVFSLSQHRGLFQRVGFWPESALNSLQYIPNDVKVFLPTGAKVTCRLCLE